jgi:hypothetical protein
MKFCETICSKTQNFLHDICAKSYAKSFVEVSHILISPGFYKDNFYLSHYLITATTTVAKTIVITITICAGGGWYKNQKESINIINN